MSPALLSRHLFFSRARTSPFCRSNSRSNSTLVSQRKGGQNGDLSVGKAVGRPDRVTKKAVDVSVAEITGSSAAETLAKLQYKRPSHPTSVPLLKLFASLFPLSVKELLEDYTHRKNPLKFQHDLLLTLPFFPAADASGRRGEVVRTKLSSGASINEFVIYPESFSGKNVSVEDEQYKKMNHLIMVHGYGAGLGFYLKNFDAILRKQNWVIHAIDLLGYGCSSRPKFTALSLAEVELFFHDSFEEWLIARGLFENPQNNLVLAHSMGAYLMATYGITRRPNFCSKLLMVSPGAVIKHQRKVAVPGYFARLWEQNISPFTLVRKAGPLGSKIVSMWSARRFAKLSPKEALLLHKYAYGIFQSPGSGEYMLNFLLAPGADARHPLIERGVEKLQCKVVWWYGKEDWMEKEGGEMCSKLINEAANDDSKSTNYVMENAGHHLYLDNISKFNEMTLKEMETF